MTCVGLNNVNSAVSKI